MDIRFINPFLEAAVEVLGTMAAVSLQAGKPYLKKNQQASGDISGVVGLSGDAQGSLSVTFEFSVIKHALKAMLGEDISKVNDDARDAVGEFTNMISGSARQKLQEAGLTLSAGIPTVVDGPGHNIHHTVNGPTLVIPFSSNVGAVVVEAALQN